jgi:hypothetical protein
MAKAALVQETVVQAVLMRATHSERPSEWVYTPEQRPPGPWTGAPLPLGRRSSGRALWTGALDSPCTLCFGVGGGLGGGDSGVGCSDGEDSGASYLGHALAKAPLLEASERNML